MDKNPADMYPEVKTLQKGELFVESVYVVGKDGNNKRIIVHKVILEKDFNTVFCSMFRREYDAEAIYPITIRK